MRELYTRRVLLCRPSVVRACITVTHRIPFIAFIQSCTHAFVRSFIPTDRPTESKRRVMTRTHTPYKGLTPHKGVGSPAQRKGSGRPPWVLYKKKSDLTKFQSATRGRPEDDQRTTDPTSHESINHPHTRPRFDSAHGWIACVRLHPCVRESRVVKVSQMRESRSCCKSLSNFLCREE